ncbi:MAG: enoyl-CoA hydratase [Candidatus Tectomicrobia bacterium]|uniref:Enoyl-CoA hydratase n=1 Tax=Tectimicrobiota bacterium TaxID=2528274 RepID=A0A933GL24_UNCTE|nr:enoyl-CoA hydratase [Candidatus Tectomicrobia bacterium]
MDYQSITFKKEKGIATITLNRPDNLNALDLTMGKEWLDAMDKCSLDREIKVIILTGEGRAFSAGGDVKSMREAGDDAASLLGELTHYLHGIISAMRRINRPVIGAINGIASGAGFSMALACDLLVASDKARFNMAYVNIGLVPDGGGTYFLPRLLGLQRASQLIFTAEAIDAIEAQKLGLVNYVVPPEQVLPMAMELAERFATGPTQAYGNAKALINSGLIESLETQLENERQAISRSSQTVDFKEGLAAFFEKRKANYKGH